MHIVYNKRIIVRCDISAGARPEPPNWQPFLSGDEHFKRNLLAQLCGIKLSGD